MSATETSEIPRTSVDVIGISSYPSVGTEPSPAWTDPEGAHEAIPRGALDADLARQVAAVLEPSLEAEPLVLGSDSRVLMQRLAQGLTSAELRAWMARAERTAGPCIRRQLRPLRRNQTAWLPVYSIPDGARTRSVISPGQVELAWDHVRDKVIDLAVRTEAGIGAVFSPDDFPVVVGPAGRYVTLMDGHHKLAGLMVLAAMLHRLCHEARLRNPLGVPCGALLERVPPLRQLRVPVRIVGQEKDADARSYVERLSDPTRYSPPIYLTGRNGLRADVPPSRFSDLLDNPFRKLATDLALKAKVKESGIQWKGAKEPLWIKLPTAPDFVEFSVARVLEAVFHAQDRVYDPRRPIDPELRETLRAGLVAARRNPAHPQHGVLRQIPLVESPSPADSIQAAVRSVGRVGRGRQAARRKCALRLRSEARASGIRILLPE